MNVAPGGGPWGIRQKFLALVTASVALFMVTAFFITRAMLEEYALSAADDTAAVILDQTDRRLSSFFAELEALARGLAGTRIVSEVDEAGMRDLFLSTVLARKSFVRAVYLGCADGRMFEWGVGPEFRDNAPTFPAGYDPRVRPWYRSGVERGGFGVSEPYKYASVDDVGITCVLPVSGTDGTLVGVLGIDILLERLGSVLAGLRIPRQGQAFIIGGDGGIIASQRPEDKPYDGRLARFQPWPLAAAGSVRAVLDGRETQLLRKRIDGLDWTVVVALPLEPIRESMRRLIDLISLVEIALLVALVAALSAVTGRLIVTPLEHMVSIINRVEAGERGLRANARSSDEFGVLGSEFNRLLDTVGDYQASLEEKVRERTEETMRLQRENSRLRVIEERRRIYRDLHDSIGAKLTNIFFCANVARDLAFKRVQLGEGSNQEAARLGQMIDTIDANCTQAVDSLKSIILGMSADDRRASSFALSLSTGLRRRLETASIRLDCVIKDRRAIESLPTAVKEELERLVDEMASNALRHSRASLVRLRLSLGKRGLALAFSDDGVGLDPAALNRGAGLSNIRYRATSLGGQARLESALGAGTAWRILVPPAALDALGTDAS